MNLRFLSFGSSLALLASCVGNDPAAVAPASGADGGTTEGGGPGASGALAIVSVEPLSAAPGRPMTSTIVIERRAGLAVRYASASMDLRPGSRPPDSTSPKM